MNIASFNPVANLEKATEIVTEVIELLEQEQAALLKKDTAECSVLMQQKMERMQQLEVCIVPLQQAIVASGRRLDKEGLSMCLKNCSHSDEALQVWQQLSKQLYKARYINRSNQMLAHKIAHHNQIILNLLTQDQANPPLYNASGKTQQSVASMPTVAS